MNKYPISFWLLVVTEGFMAIGYSISFPFLAIYLSSVKNISISFVGIFLSFSLLLASTSNIFGGEFSDKFGRKKIMFFALFSRSILIFIISAIIKFDLPIFYLFIVHPIGLFVGSFFNPAAKAYVADFVPPDKRLNAYGIMRIGTNAGWAIGPGIGASMLSSGDFYASFSKRIILT